MSNTITTKHPDKPPTPRTDGKAQAPQQGPETESDAGEEDPGAALDMPSTREAMAPDAPRQDKGGDALGGGRK
ncbi:hypothetical protein LRH25_20750 [Ideonella azotifigens]|uniref:MatE family transporter n=1 Tax=Ideonella azotifigens TaxID=513160 RepID=A0ABN1JZ26_9BURK|nr:hypothetical protein [Ideonella azotifigens]MCD2342762.1 hypothetical protein [Ideonella azotifigens]